MKFPYLPTPHTPHPTPHFPPIPTPLSPHTPHPLVRGPPEYVTIYGRNPQANLTRKTWQLQLRKEL
ncbi:MAG: hypothetical protein EWV55_12805 [Microcystis viridis Mv_BB_P_19951000_S69]|uniref:Uncharacterized protein n=1 Tax=Microcystis viridis Mv_BB_P_19951000_S68D TaxID=2486270 RepID=A0A552HWA8_MICVR|nr:MAG: hypothetical protein EWV47_18545 [Microcystis viridis Mv_BB_P_19951000_S68]TRU73614.1 MAG: hypothetical protein EWV55_12805 [Microcystis viridis Mv_BB_P_19951000_S69]TRU75497.1 MAG: hypothetical protein EWV77_08555 [Microcystis viridis Mv_BB_P_19951000_S68D]TRU88944.1 MAG: hypothetical protein EWV46_04940 [Microcystis viridis Mv_BB_P_19951000_S69D]